MDRTPVEGTRRYSFLVYIVKRLVGAAITLVLVATMVFVIFYALPNAGGAPRAGGISPTASLLAGRNRTTAKMLKIQKDLGLDKPLHVQIERYLLRLVRGDLGFSYAAGTPVSKLIVPAIPATLSLVLGASVVWAGLGVLVGTISATQRGSNWDWITKALAWAGQSIPIFVVSLVALALLFKYVGIYAGNRYVGLTRDPIRWLEAMWLPWLCLAFPLIAVYARMIRSSLVEVAEQDYIKTALAKGATDRQILKLQLRAALTPLVTMYGLDVGIMIGGSVIIEQIFQIPGLGNLLLASRSLYDFPVMSAVVMIDSAAVILANLAIDIVYGWLDPRVLPVGSR
ncbi:MAG: ABC transporter permease [Actinomycetota bacterium]|nr:ABC transporter permease [Actinomycetota bacterium]